jgi:signal transduction histidine kinase
MTLSVKALDWDIRAERLIASLRLALAAGSLTVIWLDPTQPARHWSVAYTAFVLYLLYSGVVFQMARTRPRPWLPIVTQVIDLLWVLPVLYFTEGANTPFFPFFVVFTLNAGIRWGGWGAWSVSFYNVLVYGWLLLQHTPAELDLNNDLMQLGYFLIVGALGGFLAEYRRRRETELHTLQAISEEVGRTHEAIPATAALVNMATRLRLADVVVAVLREPGDGDVVMIRSGPSDITRLSPGEVIPFFEAAAGPPLTSGGRTVPLTEAATVILRFADADTGVAYPIRSGTDLVGAIFFLVRASRITRHASDDFLGLLLRSVVPQIETLYVLERARLVQVLEERRRIARDLHDSFIQVLAALGLRLDVLGATSARDPVGERLRQDLADMRETITDELRRVRVYLAEMREPVNEIGSLHDLIERTTEAFRARTQIPVDVTVDREAADVSGAVVRDVAPILREALTNVEKHARATRVTVSACLAGQQLSLIVRDEGVGFGRAEPPAPAALPGHGQGIASMRERARLLGGTLTLECPNAGGTVLALSIPLPVRA